MPPSALAYSPGFTLTIPTYVIRTWLLTSLLFLQAMAALAQGLPPSEVKTEQLRATLVAHAPQGLRGGQGIWLGLRLQHEPHWHTYWRNPGDSGLPTTLEWTLPPGFVAGEIDWPAPRRLPVGPLMNHGYEGIVVLPVQVQVPPNFQGDQLDVRVQAQWLVCKDVCIPDGAQLGLSLPARAASSLHAADFEAAWAARPVAAPAALQGSAQVNPGQPAMDIRVKGWPAAMQGRGLELYVEQAEVLNPASSVPGTWADGVWTARWPLAASRSTTPDRIDVVLRIEGQPQTWRMNWPVQGNWPDPALSAPATPSENPSPTASSSPPDRSTFLMSLLLAALGGALLNLMPCVFPVLSLKVLALSRHPAERRALLAGGLAYSIGVVASFLALAGLLLALRAGGEQLGWGFQLQSPAFVIALILLFTLMGLNLAGVWSSGTWLPAPEAPLGGIGAHGSVGRGGSLTLHRSLHGRGAGLGRCAAGAPGTVGLRRTGCGNGGPLSACLRRTRLDALDAPARGLDGHLQAADGLPDVGDRAVAAVGARAAIEPGGRDWHTRLRPDAGFARLGHPARPRVAHSRAGDDRGSEHRGLGLAQLAERTCAAFGV